MAAEYIAGLCTNLTYTLRPERIIIGGGVMQPHMYDLVRQALVRQLGGYDAKAMASANKQAAGGEA